MLLALGFNAMAETALGTGIIAGGVRKSLLRIYHLHRDEFLPSAYSMIVTLVGLILLLRASWSFFFLALLGLLNVISTPFGRHGVD